MPANVDLARVLAAPEDLQLRQVLADQGFDAQVTGNRLAIRGTTKVAVSELAFEHGIRLVGLSEGAPSLEETFLGMTGAAAEFASA